MNSFFFFSSFTANTITETDDEFLDFEGYDDEDTAGGLP